MLSTAAMVTAWFYQTEWRELVLLPQIYVQDFP